MTKRDEYSLRNKRPTFKLGLREIESEIRQQIDLTLSEENDVAVSLKDVPISDIIAQFDQSKQMLQEIFDERHLKGDHLNKGNGFDYCTVLARVVTPEQQHEMMRCLNNAFTPQYFRNPKVRWIKLNIKF